MQRKCGLMLHISSLPNKYGFGCFSKDAYDFIDFLKKSGQHYWQVLPFNPTNNSGSPFQCYSVFAGNPNFIDLTEFLNEKELSKLNIKPTTEINFKELTETRINALKFIFNRDYKKYDLEEFKKQNAFWLQDYAVFMALKDFYNGVEYTLFPEPLKKYDKKAVKEFSEQHKTEVEFHIFVQYLFLQQWTKIKNYANENGIEIIGDIAFYPATDSSDTWANRENFCIDEECKPTGIAGVPPDYFSADGQLWGNPVYNVKKMKKDKYVWWVKRFQQAHKFYDIVRLDHFRGFESFWMCKPKAKTAKGGKWVKSFGLDLFKELKKHRVPGFIAEDLGVITQPVKDLMKKCGFPGMKVFQFAFDGDPKNAYYPHNYTEDCVAYIGTHDNNTFVGFLQEEPNETLKMVKEYLSLPDESTYEQITDLSLAVMLNSLAQTVIFTVQDVLKLDQNYRMNIPGTPENNWKFVLPQGLLTDELAQNLRNLTIAANRI